MKAYSRAFLLLPLICNSLLLFLPSICWHLFSYSLPLLPQPPCSLISTAHSPYDHRHASVSTYPFLSPYRSYLKVWVIGGLVLKHQNFKKARITKCIYLFTKITPCACAREEQLSLPSSHSISALQPRAAGAAPTSIRAGPGRQGPSHRPSGGAGEAGGSRGQPQPQASGRAWRQEGSLWVRPEFQAHRWAWFGSGNCSGTSPKWVLRPCRGLPTDL